MALELLRLGILDGIATLVWSHINVHGTKWQVSCWKPPKGASFELCALSVCQYRACEEHAIDVGIDVQEGAKGRVLAADHIVVANASSSPR